MTFLAGLPESERDAFRHFVEGPGIRVMFTFLDNAVSKASQPLFVQETPLENIRFQQGKCAAYKTVAAFLNQAVKEYSSPA